MDTAGFQPAGSQREQSSILPAISSVNMPKINLDMEIRLQGKAQGKKKNQGGKYFYEVRQFRLEG